MSVDGLAAAQTMIAFGTWRAGFCLEAVWRAYKANGARTDRNAATATIGWDLSDGKHHGDRNPPPGVPVWFGKKSSSAAGDVVISLGGGRVVATDWPRNGVIGITTIDARQKQIGRPYLGWTETILGAAIDYERPTTPTPTPTPTPDPEEDDDMAKNTGIYWIDERGVHMCAILNTVSGFFDSFESEHTNAAYNNPVAAAFGTGDFVKVTVSHANKLARDCAAVRSSTP